jgi:AmmeMemoRadiSam system protein B
MLDADTRRPAVAGLFYPDDPARLRDMAGGMLAEVDAESAPAVGAVVPHAGLVYSGQCAAHVWKRIRIPETVVVLAPNHTGAVGSPGASLWARGRFTTPLGDVPVAEAFAEQLTARCALVAHDPSAHMREHAIEVELPFLRLIAADTRIVPIVLAWDRWEPTLELATALAESVRAGEGDVLLVASSDMTHYESAAAAERKDRLAVDAMQRLDGEDLLSVCHRQGVSMCGRAPAAVVIEASRQLGATSVELVDYRHSGLVTGDDREVVTYAGLVIR